jgi:hypothetical protein
MSCERWPARRNRCRSRPRPGAVDWQAFFEEVAGVAEVDGGLRRAEADAVAFECCLVEWLNLAGISRRSASTAWRHAAELIVELASSANHQLQMTNRLDLKSANPVDYLYHRHRSASVSPETPNGEPRINKIFYIKKEWKDGPAVPGIPLGLRR